MSFSKIPAEIRKVYAQSLDDFKIHVNTCRWSKLVNLWRCRDSYKHAYGKALQDRMLLYLDDTLSSTSITSILLERMSEVDGDFELFTRITWCLVISLKAKAGFMAIFKKVGENGGSPSDKVSAANSIMMIIFADSNWSDLKYKLKKAADEGDKRRLLKAYIENSITDYI